MRQRAGLFQWFGVAVLSVVAMFAVSFLAGASPRPAHLMAVRAEKLGEVSEQRIPRAAKPAYTTYQPPTAVWLLREGDSWVALSNVTHHPKGCNTAWDQRSGRFIEPCLGSVFDRHGLNIAGPAPRGLDVYPVTVQPNGWLEIDLGRPTKP